MRNISHPVDNRKNVLYTICEISLIFYRKEVYPEAWCSGKVVENKKAVDGSNCDVCKKKAITAQQRMKPAFRQASPIDICL